MGKKLYVGNLPYSVTDESLNQIFSEVGEVVSAKVITYRDTGRSKGFGFIEMASDDLALQAIEKMNGTELEGRPLKVNEARPMESRPPRDSGGSDDSGDSGDSGGGRNNRW